MRIDLHTHSNVSDGTDTPAELVAAAAAAGLAVVALTDHDTFDGLAAAWQAGERYGVEVVGGVEVSARHEGGSVHVLGYGCDPTDAALSAELARVRDGRSGRLGAMLDRLGELGMPLTAAEVLAQSADATSLGRPHVADALVAAGYSRHRDEAFARWLYEGGPAYVDRYATPLVEAIELIRAAGGVAVLAHPWGRGGRERLAPEFLADLVAAHQLAGVEVDHVDHDDATRAELAAWAATHGVLALGSSDYHGTGKSANPLGVFTTHPDQYAALRGAMADAAAGRVAALR